MDGKKFWLSKTFWLNVLAIIALIVQSQTGYVISPEAQVSILGVLNVILRFITKAPISWS
uniref:Uncharacterized protein n=1 Tax=viral metagenome TaxID=1070528 RepID=A0A6M3J079_9ZZZZ